MKKYLDILDNGCIIVEKIDKHGNKYYVEKNIYDKNKRVKNIDFRKSIMFGNYQEINQELLKKAKKIYIDTGLLFLEFSKESDAIKYKNIDINGTIYISVELQLFDINEIRLFSSFC